MSDEPIIVAALYRFVPLPDFVELREPFQQAMERHRVRGTLLLACEGINGTLAGSRAGIDGLIDFLRRDARLTELGVKESRCSEMPFKRSRVRLKKEIVTMGVDGINPNQSVGTYIDPDDWNELIDDPEVIVIDTRNDYEVAIGTFQGAIDPSTKSFREFPAYAASELDAAEQPKIAMFCTGGIRCEKATAYLKQQGFENVYHLRGGILKYLETVPPEDSRWQGECFVFDGRVSVGHGLVAGEHEMCFGCGWPVSAEQRADRDYVAGVHCPRCIGEITPEQRKRFAERQRQIESARQEC